MGVGLSIVKAIMDSMNQQYGVINYTNGVEFWIELETGNNNGGAIVKKGENNRSVGNQCMYAYRMY